MCPARPRSLASAVSSLFCAGLVLAVVFALVAAPLRSSADDAPSKASASPPADEAEAAAAQAPAENPFPGRFPAPSLDGGVEWFNTSGPIDLKDLRGKIVLLDFWTYCCINCIHVIPDLKYLEEKYADQLVVIGVHAPKFENEKDSENIRRAILRYEIEHPVVNDANMTIARKYFFNSWPTLVLIDPEGQFVGRQPGEGHRELFDTVIGRMVEYHRAKGTLDETPIRFDLEKDKVEPTPLRFPGKVLADQAGNRLFISDSNHNRIIISDLEGNLLDTIGTGAIGNRDGGYDEAQFDHPQGMALVGETLYVADTENHLIRTVDLASRSVSTLAGTGVQARRRVAGGPLREVALNSPWALCELKGVLYIAMAGPHQLWKHELDSNTVEVFAGSGREDIIDGPRDSSALAQPSGIVTDGTALYHVDSEGSAVRKVEVGPGGQVTTVVGPHDLPRGRSLFEFGDIDGKADKVRLQHPLGLVYHQGQLFVADAYNHKIKRVKLEDRSASTLLGTGERGTSLDPLQLSEPGGLTIAGQTLFIADTNNHRVLTFNLETDEVAEFRVAGLTPPQPPQVATTGNSGPPAIRVEPQSVRPGQALQFAVEIQIPEGFKLNELAPVTARLEAKSPQSLLEAEQLGDKVEVRMEGTAGLIEYPLAADSGDGEFELTVSWSYCRSGQGGVCRFAREKFAIPVRISSDATADRIRLTAGSDDSGGGS
ncbi:Thiol-disulfide oxidoreductase YkuV [Maioricimonas rarisocia]|uniref:Thiol-disulfide oxidoreductase YkuV n=1 Tax=Maioricimonas rarisocia TaxID=2528026 RepID=A0A517ZCV1_9PLAN|nr:thioredoxin-like domain-containing protein [Maioricimonas rarisocia]QDU40270.1 Thiol-disulfide oxidoreductase YkuV [Maioricimonas rarisocia]